MTNTATMPGPAAPGRVMTDPTAKAITPAGPRVSGGSGLLIVLVVLATLVGGCGSYRLQGVVVDGATPAVLVTDPGTGQVQGRRIGGAVVEIVLDPRSLSPKRVGSVMTDDVGAFDAPVDVLGAGFLEYEVGIRCRATGFSPVQEILMLPAKGKKLVVVLVPGRDQQPSPRWDGSWPAGAEPDPFQR